MLEFIVLGQIPGTGVIITFSWVIGIATILFGSSLLRSTHKRHGHVQSLHVDEVTA